MLRVNVQVKFGNAKRELLARDDVALGQLIREYLGEMENGDDAFTTKELLAIKAFLVDINTYAVNR